MVIYLIEKTLESSNQGRFSKSVSAFLAPGPDPTLGTEVYYTALKKKKLEHAIFHSENCS